MDLAGTCAVVTGGGHGIGRALAERLAREGAQVVVADVNGERAEKVARNVGGLAVTCDVGQPEAVHDLVERANAEFGPVRVFCSNAGINDLGPDLASTPEQIRTVVDVNLLAHVWAAQEVVPQNARTGRGLPGPDTLVGGADHRSVEHGLHVDQTRRRWDSPSGSRSTTSTAASAVTCICPNVREHRDARPQ